jgi:integrase
MRKRLTPAFVLKAPPPEKGDRIIYWDPDPRGFGLMITAAGRKSYVVQYRAHGRSRRYTLKGGLSLSAARKEATKLVGDIARGGDPVDKRRNDKATADKTLRSIAGHYFQREGEKLRSFAFRRARFENHVFPTLGSRQISSIRRSEIVSLLDRIEDTSGPQAAQSVLRDISRLFNWHAGRDDDFKSPVTRGMSRAKAASRERILSDDELRAIWRAAEASTGPFGRFVQLCLLTAARRTECAEMTRAELEGNVWTIPSSRMKSKIEHAIPLSAAAMAILADIPVTGRWIFTSTGRRPIRGFTKYKASFDQRSGVTGWRLHDLRRTARSLLSRAGVDADIAERCLAHTIGGIRQIYDRHQYLDEKRRAFEALAALLDRIINPPAENVVAFHAGISSSLSRNIAARVGVGTTGADLNQDTLGAD